MSDAQKLMSDVQRVHVYDVKSPDGLCQCECGYVLDDDYPDMVPHISAEIDKALGGLAREWATGYGYPCPSAGDFVAVDTFRTRDEAKAQSDRVMASNEGITRREEVRWVSGWGR